MTNVLSWIVFLPLLGAVVLTVLPKNRPDLAKWTAAAFMVVDLGLTVWVTASFDQARGAVMQFTENIPWVPQVGINYHLGVDGISITMLFLSALLGLIAIVASWNVKDRAKMYFAMLLLLQVGMNGVFVALDFVLFYVFWELVLVPMFFLIGIWGGARREYASIKFFIYTLAGSVFMLVGILVLYLNSAPHTFDIVALSAMGASTCASGSQVCSGQMGTFTANPRKKSPNVHRPMFAKPPVAPTADSCTMSNVCGVEFT
jgi:NADH-quinone oxidoreductase subunit M